MRDGESAGSHGREEYAPTMHPVGRSALLLDASAHPAGGLAGALQLLAGLRQAADAGTIAFDELVPAAQTVLVRGGIARSPRALAAVLPEIIGAPDARSHNHLVATATQSPTVIPVVYDGADLDAVAQLTGLSTAQVINRHTASQYTVAFTGFTPGFAYLSGGDAQLTVPRRSTPRARIPAGSVGLAGEFSGVYPRESPGGWQLIGHTEATMWDLDREHPATLVPGGTVRFQPVRQRVQAAPGATSDPKPTAGEAVTGAAARPTSAGATTAASTRGSQTDEPESRTPVLRVDDAGLLTLIQDAGRPGLADLGVSAAGAADRPALAAANQLVGNQPTAGGLELGVAGFSAQVLATTVLALAGAPRPVHVEGPLGTRTAALERAFRADPGDRLVVGPPARGLRTILAVRGGLEATPTLGSSSADTLAGLGPAALAAGDVLAVPAAQGAESFGAGRTGWHTPGRRSGTARPVGRPDPARPPAEAYPAPGQQTMLNLVPGPRDDWFGQAGLDHLCATAWQVTPRSDRVGVRLAGRPVPRTVEFEGRELPSEGLVPGAIQVPADGQPVLFLADHPLTGGYPVIAVVDEHDLAMAAQLPPGTLVRFVTAPPTTEPKETRP